MNKPIILLICIAMAGVSIAEESPEAVCQRFITEAKEGNTNNALSCLYYASERGNSALQEINELASGKIDIEIVRSFTNDSVALVAVLMLQTNKQPPECDYSWIRLFYDKKVWRIVNQVPTKNPKVGAAYQKLLRITEAYMGELRVSVLPATSFTGLAVRDIPSA